MPWFRRKLREKTEEAPTEAAAPQVPQPDPPADAGTIDETKRKRRRGTRGGRGRKRVAPPPQLATAPVVLAEADEQNKKPARAREDKPERRSQQSERRAEARRERPQRRRAQQQKRSPLPAAKRELLVSVDVGEQRVAVLEDGRVAEVYLERPERRSIAGNIYKGTVDNVLPGMEAAFVEIGLGKNGFLYVDEIVGPELEGRRRGRKIQDLLSRGQDILVQAVKDPMKSKGARLTTEISLPGRFVVYVPHGEGLGVSRRLDDDERTRLRDILKALELPSGGLIVRTAAEGASAEDIERDVVFLQRLWKSVEARAEEVKAPALVYQEAELPLRVVRDLFAGDFERALIDDDLTHKRVVGYLKKTSPHMVDRVNRYREKEPLFAAYGVEDEIRSTLSRRVDLPSGGYLVFDYAEAFTVVDVNTGRFTGSRSKSGSGLEDTITKNNLEAVKEVVRQLRLRDIGGIIVIDFIDMANPRNRAQVEDALKTELERDRTKTYVVEISPLGLVEMTRQNVTDGPREILTKRCPTCGGDGILLSEASAALDAERRLRTLATRSRVQAFRVELNAHVREVLVGPGASRLTELESRARRRFFLEGRDDAPLDHFVVVTQGKLEDLAPKAPVNEGDEIQLKLVEIGRHDSTAGVGRVDGYPVLVGGAAKLVGKKVKTRLERVLDGAAFGALLEPAPALPPAAPVTAESEAEKPTRRARVRKIEEPQDEALQATVEPVEEVETGAEAGEQGEESEQKPKRKTRRGSRGGRGRKRKTTTVAATSGNGEVTDEVVDTAADPPAKAVEEPLPAPAAPRIHVPDVELGRNGDDADEQAPSADTAESAESADGDSKPKRKTRRGSRGGRNRRKKPAAALEEAADAAAAPTGAVETT